MFFIFSGVLLHFYCWYFTSFWNKISILILIWILMCRLLYWSQLNAMSRLYCILVIIYHCVQLSTNMTSQNKWVQHKLVLFFYVHGTVYPYNIVLVSNQRDAAFVLLGLLSLYMFRARFASIFIHKTVMAATSVCQCVWVDVILFLVVYVRWIWVQCGLGVHEDSVVWWSSFLHHISTFLHVTTVTS